LSLLVRPGMRFGCRPVRKLARVGEQLGMKTLELESRCRHLVEHRDCDMRVAVVAGSLPTVLLLDSRPTDARLPTAFP
jgi:hypothetical protein